ncbi:hypothetical protein ACOME3_003078 [Neoechinorhynchus agilis]
MKISYVNRLSQLINRTRTTRGFVAAMGSISVFTAVQFIPLPTMTSLQYMSVVFTIVMARIFLKEQLRLLHIPMILVSILGVLLVSNPQWFVPMKNNGTTVEAANSTTSTSDITIGVSLALTTAFAQASAFCLVRKLSHGQNRVKNMVLIFNFALISVPLLLAFCIIYRLVKKSKIIVSSRLHDFFTNRELSKIYGPDAGFSILAASFGLLAQMACNIALKTVNAGYFSLVRGLEIPFSFILQVIFFDLNDHYVSYIGIVLIILSVWFINLDKIWRSRQATKQEDQSVDSEAASIDVSRIAE